MAVLEDFDLGKFLVLVVPGAIFALFSSFAIRGKFPSLVKDDFAAFLFGAVIYDFILASTEPNPSLPVPVSGSGCSFWFWLLVLIVVPLMAGFLTGSSKPAMSSAERSAERGSNCPLPPQRMGDAF